MAIEQITYDVIEQVREIVRSTFDNWPGASLSAYEEGSGCPLGLVCFSSCFWWEDGRCTFPREGTSRARGTKARHKWHEASGHEAIPPGTNKDGKKRNRKFREYIGHTLLTSTSCALLWFLGCIWLEGSHYIQEPNTIILGIETAGIAAISSFAISNLIRLLRRLKTAT